MKLTIPKSNLQHALRRVQGAISGRPLNPWMACVLLKATDGKLQAMATNLDVQISHTTEATVIEPGEALLPISSFLQFVTQFGPQDVELAVDDKFHCTLECGDSRGSLSGMDPKDFTPFPPQERKGFTMAQSDLKAALRKTLIAVSVDSTRFTLCGVLIELQANRLSIIATNGRQISIVRQLLDGDGIRAIVPTNGATQVSRLLEDDGEVSVSIGKNTAEFEIGGTTLSTKLIDSNYPSINQFIPKNAGDRIVLNREEFLGAVKYVSWIVDPHKYPIMTMEFGANKLGISQKSTSDNAQRTIAVKYDKADKSLRMPSDQMAIILSALTDDEVALEIIDHLSPVCIKAGNFTAIAMPMLQP